jgi:predicted RND superfamily exporter protein
MWNKVASVTLRYRVAIGILLCVLTCIMAFIATKTEMAYELQKVIPDDDTTNVVYERFKETFGEDGSVMVIGVATEKLFQLDFFKDWYEFTQDIDSIANVKKLISLTKLYELRKNDSLYQFEVKSLVARSPESQKEVDSIRQRISQLPFYHYYLYNPDKNATFIAVTLDDDAVNSKRRVEMVEEIERLGSILSAKHDVTLHYSGVPYIRTVNTKKISSELILFTFLSIVITGIFLLIFFRSFQIVVTSLIIVLVSLVYTIGSIYICGYKVGILTALIPPLIVVIVIQNCIYLLNVYHYEYKSHGNKIKALNRTISKIGLASFLTNVTTAVGFGAFSFTGSSIMDEFGRLAALDIMIAYVLCVLLIPIIYSFLPAPNAAQLKHLDRKTLSGVLRFVNKVVFRHRKWVYGSSIVIVLVSLVGTLKISNVGYILDGISPKDKLYKDLKFFEASFSGTFPYEIWIDTKEPGKIKDLSVLQKIEKLNRELKSYQELSKPLAITEILKFTNQAYYDGNAKRYVLPNPLDMGKIMNLMPQNIDRNNNDLLRNLVDTNFQITRVSMQIADVGTHRNEEITHEIRQKIDSIFPAEDFDVQITGKSVVHVKGNSYLIVNLLEGLGWAFAIISILMALLFSSFRMILIAIVPNILPLFMTLGIMGFAGIQLKESTILIFSVAFGIVVDLTIHYLAKYRMELKKYNWNIVKSVEASIEHSGFSMIYTTVILFFGFIIFAFSSFQGTQYLGLLTSMCLAFGLLSNLFLLPSLMLSIEKKVNMKKIMSNSVIELEDET